MVPDDAPADERLHEPIRPVPGSFDVRAMARGEPGLPRRFVWRGEEIRVERIERRGKETEGDRGDVYVRRHVWVVRTEDGRRMELYADRDGRRGRPRWWIRRVLREPSDQVENP